MTDQRQYPVCAIDGEPAQRPMSFVVVRFSSEFEHNFEPSRCAGNPLNEVIVVDNTANLFFDNLSSAIRHGIERATNELVAVVHEDVHLVDGWQRQFERSLRTLEAHDPRWGMVGSVGWDRDNQSFGHWSDPFRYRNDFAAAQAPFRERERLDEQLLVFHRRRLPDWDEQLPGIHHLGRALAQELRQRGLRTFALDAPTIHKFRDRGGQLVQNHEQSEKIRDRRSQTYLADKACCDDYVARTWPELKEFAPDPEELRLPSLTPAQEAQLDRPVVLLSRGGSGSRLLTTLAGDLGLFPGSDLNASGDCMAMVQPIYRAVFEQYLCRADWQKAQSVPRLRAAAARMIKTVAPEQPWGFKLPESLLVLPQIQAAFPRARFLHLVRDPVATCLRRTHMTARLDNHIGRVALAAAYDHAGLPRRQVLTDSPALHMARTTDHQLRSVMRLRESLREDRFVECRFEEVLADPGRVLDDLGRRLGMTPVSTRIIDTIDPDRARRPSTVYGPEAEAACRQELSRLRRDLGYPDVFASESG